MPIKCKSSARRQCTPHARRQCTPRPMPWARPKQSAIQKRSLPADQKRSLPADQKWQSVEETIKEIMGDTSLGTKEKRKYMLLQMKWHHPFTSEISLLRHTIDTLNIALTAEKISLLSDTIDALNIALGAENASAD